MSDPPEPYYRRDLALVHDRGFSFHAEACAPGLIDLLAPVRARAGVVLDWAAEAAASRSGSSPPATG